MPSFESSKLWWWEQFKPSLGNNRDLPTPFYFNVKAGLTKLELQRVMEELGKSEGKLERISAAMAGVVEPGAEPLTVDGKPVMTLAEYLDVCAQTTCAAALIGELVEAMKWFNSFEGTRALFSGRLSGGWASTSRGNGSEKPVTQAH